MATVYSEIAHRFRRNPVADQEETFEAQNAPIHASWAKKNVTRCVVQVYFPVFLMLFSAEQRISRR